MRKGGIDSDTGLLGIITTINVGSRWSYHMHGLVMKRIPEWKLEGTGSTQTMDLYQFFTQ